MFLTFKNSVQRLKTCLVFSKQETLFQTEKHLLFLFDIKNNLESLCCLPLVANISLEYLKKEILDFTGFQTF